jgi:hypothetical protein
MQAVRTNLAFLLLALLAFVPAAHIQKERHQESVKDVDINVELQADCCAGMFLTAFAASGSLTPNGPRDILNDARESGDDPSAPISERDHGTAKQRADAVKRGYNGTLPTACDPIGSTTPDRHVGADEGHHDETAQHGEGPLGEVHHASGHLLNSENGALHARARAACLARWI